MESKKPGLIILAIIFCAVALYLTIRISTEGDEARIRRTIYAGVLAAEKGDALRCISFVSNSYADSYGNDKASLLKVIMRVFRDFKNFKIDIKKIKIEIKEAGAKAEISFKCYFKKPGQDQIYYDTGRLKVSFQKEEGRWRVSSTEYQGAKELESVFLQGVI